MFFTPYNRKSVAEPKGTAPRLVETAGVLTVQQQINSILAAGKRLADYRKAHYDIDHAFAERVDYHDISPDPTRSSAFDMSDATIIMHDLGSRAKEMAKKNKANESMANNLKSETMTENEPILEPNTSAEVNK